MSLCQASHAGIYEAAHNLALQALHRQSSKADGKQ